MSFGQIGLQSQGLIRVDSRPLASRRHRVSTVVQITLVPGKTGVSQSEVWIEFDRLFEKRLSLQRRLAKLPCPSRVIARLNIEQVRFGACRWPAIKPRPFVG